MPNYLINGFSVLKLSGEDAVSFLHGQVTCDVNKLSATNFLPGCHCNAKGKMWSTFIATKQNEDILLILTSESAAQTLAELNKYGVFAKVEITDDSENWKIIGSQSKLDSSFSFELDTNHWLSLFENNVDVTAEEDDSAWWQQEIMSGRAHIYQTTSIEYVPQMLNLQALDYISFNKGCYMGQEMVARMRYLGKNKRALYLATADEAITLTPGDPVAIDMNGNKRSSGKVIQSIQLDGKTYSQIVLPNDTELATPIYVGSDLTSQMTLHALPYSLEQN